MAKPRPVWYEPHPVTPERKAHLIARGYRIIDAAFAPPGHDFEAQNADDAHDDDAHDDDTTEIAVSQGLNGKWFVKKGDLVVAGPFNTESKAKAVARGRS